MRFCPRCGKQSLSSQDQYLYTCSTCNFLFYMNTAGTVVSVIRNDQHQILMTVRGEEPGAGTLDLPGGFIDRYETAEEALLREVKEELNLRIKEYQFLFSAHNRYPYRDILYHTIDFFFLCRAVNPEEITPSDEIREYRFVRLEEIKIEEIGFPSIRNGIIRLRERVRNGEVDL
jgi:NAD+ diphosphatase